MIRAMAPYRISFGGGGSDVPPYCWEEGGAVLNATIDRHAYATITCSDRVRLVSDDTGELAEYTPGRLPYDGRLDLLKAPYNLVYPGASLEVRSEAEAPPGSGLGGSSSLAVALVAALLKASGREANRHEVAMLAYRAEREELRQLGGYQDQFAAAYGGINYMEFSREGVRVEGLRLDQDLRLELQYRTLLFYLGKARRSYEIHGDMQRRYEEDKERQREHRRALREIASGMRSALLKGDLEEFGELIHKGWLEKKSMSDMISDELIDRAYEVAREAGAIGGKVLGAGGGGHFMAFVRPEKRGSVISALSSIGLVPVQFKFEKMGVVIWRARKL